MPFFQNKISRFLISNLNSEQLRYTIESFVKDFDLYKFSGISRSLSITKKDAVSSIMLYLDDEGRILDYVSSIVALDGHGAGSSGRIKIRNFDLFLNDISTLGWFYNNEHHVFEKDQSRIKTRDFGILRHGQVYPISFMNIDLAGSSKFANHLDTKVLTDLYENYRLFCEQIVHNHNGRIWEWNGDGFTGAFFGKNDSLNAFLAAQDFLIRIYYFQFQYKHLSPKTKLEIRIGADRGMVEFNKDKPALGQANVKKAEKLQSDFCESGQLTVSRVFLDQLPVDFHVLFQKSPTLIEFDTIFHFLPGREKTLTY